MKKIITLIGLVLINLLVVSPFVCGASDVGGFGDTEKVKDVDVPGASEAKEGGSNTKLINNVKTLINYVLGFLFIIAFVLLLYGGFQMLLAAGDESKFKKGFKILKTTAGGLLFIALSWAIVQVIFAGIGQLK